MAFKFYRTGKKTTPPQRLIEKGQTLMSTLRECQCRLDKKNVHNVYFFKIQKVNLNSAHVFIYA